MSLAAAQAFREEVSRDAELQELVRSAFASGSVGALIARASERGFDFTAEELEATASTVDREAELSDFELELVSAGIAVNCSQSNV